jgi:hypothetical protein
MALVEPTTTWSLPISYSFALQLRDSTAFSDYVIGYLTHLFHGRTVAEGLGPFQVRGGPHALQGLLLHGPGWPLQ